MSAKDAGILLAALLVCIGALSCWFQWRGRKALKARDHVPQDEERFLRGRYRRRAFAGLLMIVAGGMIGYAYLSGMEAAADTLQAERDEDGGKKAMADKDKSFVRTWGLFWIAVILIAFLLISVAMVDAWASRRYWMSLYKEIRSEHEARLRRDIAVYKQQKDDRGARRGAL